MAVKDCIKIKKGIDPEDLARFETAFSELTAGGIKPAAAYTEAAEIAMESILAERNELASEIIAKGGFLEPVTIENLLNPASFRNEPAPDASASRKGVKGRKTTLPMDKESRLKRAREQGFDTRQTLYHGTLSDFTAFDTDRKTTSLGGIHVGSRGAAVEKVDQMAGPADQDWDRQQDMGNTPQIMPVFIRLRNPLRLDDLGIWDYQSVLREARKAGVDITEDEYTEIFNLPRKRDNNRATRELLKSKGYDGIVYKNKVEAIGSTSYILFDPEQLRSINATFDPAETESPTLLASRKGATKADQDPTARRTFLKRVLGTAMAGGAIRLGMGPTDLTTLGRAKAISDEALEQRVPASVEKLLRADASLPEIMRILAKEGPEELRELALTLSKLIPKGKIKIVVDDTTISSNHGVLRPGNKGAVMTLYTAAGADGLNVSTVLHESLHAAIAARYYSLGVASMDSNYKVLGISPPKAIKAIEQLKRVWDEFEKAAKEQGIKHTAILEAIRSPDEFFIRALTDPITQEFMAGIEYKGRTLLERFIDWVKVHLFGYKKTGEVPSWLDAALLAANDILDAMRADAPSFSFSGAVIKKRGKAAEPQSSTISEAIVPAVKKVEGWLKSPMSRIKDISVKVVKDVETLRAIYPKTEMADDTVGMFFRTKGGGRIYVIASNVRTRREAHEVLAHELVGHLGLEGVLGKRKFALLLDEIGRIKAEARENPGSHPEVEQALKLVQKYYVTEIGEPALTDRQESMEILAHIAEKRPRIGPFAELYNKILNWFRNILSKWGLRVTRVDIGQGKESIEDLLESAVQYVKGVTQPRVEPILGVGVAARGGLPMDKASRERRAEEQGFTVDAFHSTTADIGAFEKHPADLGYHFGTTSQANKRLKDKEGERRYKSFVENSRTLPPTDVIEGANVIPVKLKLNNPLRLPDVGDWRSSAAVIGRVVGVIEGVNQEAQPIDAETLAVLEKIAVLYEDVMEAQDQFEEHDDFVHTPENEEFMEEARAIIQLAGYDGIVYNNIAETPWQENPKGEDSYIVFEPEQIRSVHAAFDSEKGYSAGIMASRTGELSATQRKGDLSILKKEYPEIHTAIQAALGNMSKAQEAMVRRNLKEHKGTGWALSAVKSLAIREIFDGLITGQNMDSLMNDSFWENDPISRYKMVTALSKGPVGIKHFMRGYDFLGSNRKAENDLTGSFLNCGPSKACAKFCYAVKGSQANHVNLMKSEFTEIVTEMFPEEVAALIAHEYKHTPAGLADLALRINDKGDLSEVQVALIKRLNDKGIALQVFSKRPELLRQLSDVNLKMLSIDESNFDLAEANPDLYLAVTLTDNFTESMVKKINDRVAVYLPVNFRGKVWNTKVLKAKYPTTFMDMKAAMCPVEAGKLTTRRGVSFVDIKEGVADGNWTCTACDLLGAVGCFHKGRQTANRKAAMGLFDIEVNEVQNESDKAIKGLEKQVKRLQSIGAIDAESAKTALAELRNGIRISREESKPDPEADSVEGIGEEDISYSRRGGKDRKAAPGQTELFSEEPETRASEKSRKGLGHKEASKRIPELQTSMQDLMEGKVPISEYDRMVNEHKPVDVYDEVPMPATPEEMRKALSSNKVDRIGAPAKELAEGTPVGLRLDIPAYTNHGVWVVSVHGQKGSFEAGKVYGYDNVAQIKNATFGSREKTAQRVAAGGPKSTMATIKGEWVKTTRNDALRLALESLISDEWTQVGFDPERHSYFWDRYDMRPVIAADEVIQIGPLVLAKNPQYAPKDNFLYSRKSRKPRSKAGGAVYRTANAISAAYGQRLSPMKRQIWGVLTLRQTAEQIRPLIPTIYEDYLRHYRRMETIRNIYQSRAGEIATKRRKLTNFHNNQLSIVQHESTIAGVDGDVPYEPLIDPLDAAQQIGVINEQMRGRSGQDNSVLLEKRKQINFKLKQENNRRKIAPHILKLFNALNADQKKIYRDERQFHVDLRTAIRTALLERIEEAFVDESIKGDMMVRLRTEFELASVQPPYFPLARFGEYWVHSEIKGELYFDMFETEGEWKRHHRELAEAGATILGAGKNQKDEKPRQEIPPDFITRVDKIISKLGDHPRIGEIRDEVYQLYLESLPELSARKHAIHRSKMRGFYKDHLRAFAHASRHGSNLLAKTKYGYRMQAVLDDMKLTLDMASSLKIYDSIKAELDAYIGYLEEDIDSMTAAEIKTEAARLRKAAEREAAAQTEIEPEEDGAAELYQRWLRYIKIKRQVGARPGSETTTPKSVEEILEQRIHRRTMLLSMADNINREPDPLTARRMVSDALAELKASHEANMNPDLAPWSNSANALGFFWFLGYTPAAGVVNLVQTPAVALPVAAAKFGWGPVSKHMGMITAQVGLQLRKSKDHPYFGIEKLLKNEGERAAYQRWHDEGLLDKTMAHDLGGFSEEGIYTGQLKQRIMRSATYLFHQAERMNREVTALTVYRAAIDKGLGPFSAAVAAEEIVWRTHFDYTRGNRARFMRGNTMRVITQFKQYNQNISYLYLRTLQQGWGKRTKDNPEERAEARRTLFNMLLMQTLAAGLLGWPILELLIELANLFDDEDQPEDFKANIQQWSHDKAGPFWGEAILKGLPTALGVDFHSRLTLSDLWYRSSDRELRGSSRAIEIIKTLGGPMASIGLDMFRGAEQIRDAKELSEYLRALEAMTPKIGKDILKGGRYAVKGVKSFRGADVVPRKDITNVTAAIRAFGFAPSTVSRAFDAKNAIERITDRRKQRKREITHKLEILYEQRIEQGQRGWLGSKLLGRIKRAEEASTRWNKFNVGNQIKPKLIYENIEAKWSDRLRMKYGITNVPANRDLLNRFTFGGQ